MPARPSPTPAATPPPAELGPREKFPVAPRRGGPRAELIFNTFELAGGTERWVKENLLLSVVRAPWLRVVIVGQRVPAKHGESWEGISFDLIELRSPTPEEWFDFGKPHHDTPEFTIELVRSLHATVKGKSSILAQVCGPAA